MASINRTAYPVYQEKMGDEDLRDLSQLSTDDQEFLDCSASDDRQKLALAMFLKAFDYLGYFPPLESIPSIKRLHLIEQLFGQAPGKHLDSTMPATSLHRCKEKVRHHRAVQQFAPARAFVEDLTRTAAHTMSDPADLINVAIEGLRRENIELPAFSTLDRLTNHIRQQVHLELFAQITQDLSVEQVDNLNDLLVVPIDEHFTPFNKLKKNPGMPTLKNVRLWAEHLSYITSILNPAPFLQGVSHTKVRQFAAEVEALEVQDLLDIKLPNKRPAMLLCFLHHVQTRVRDELVEMFLRRVRRTVNAAKTRLKALQEEHRALEENLLQALGQILNVAGDESIAPVALGNEVMGIFQNRGGVDQLKQQYEATSAFHQNNYLPLLWDVHRRHRAILFNLLELLEIRTATQDRSRVMFMIRVIFSKRALGLL
ncbi:DUF4158 domain-containing protein [Pseudovibrio brasiliensis]|uniref:DUF4158 domain-containing protein n=1 Tax=Pseudovibrio brasiliensis TaxID=1898042 RepID=A0ABX8AVI2_9HYPH|nr:DUF4158 domain-containing protein [Pseudovibrio brasiliensis]QUS59028.1 DUF4158 domain-containing protein [Pseudovibrio brasiliensis]